MNPVSLTMPLFLFALILMLSACTEQESNQQLVAETLVAETVNANHNEIQSDAIDSAALENARLHTWFDERYA